SPSHGSLSLQSDGSFTYSPTPGYRGSDSFTYKANDGMVNNNTVTVTIAVNNNPPVATNDNAYTPQDTAATIAVLTNDPDPDNDPLTITDVSQGAHGDVAIVGSQVQYTPHVGYLGTDSFTYTISDGYGGTASATVTVTVSDDDGEWASSVIDFSSEWSDPA